MKLNQSCISALISLSLLNGCFSSERDNIQDPANTPILQLGDVSFDNSVGSVAVSWSYLGQGAISEFQVQRRITGPYELVGALPGPSGGSLRRDALTYRDTGVPSGERLFYRISVPNDRGLATYTEGRSVQVPGARLTSITPNEGDGSIRVSWKALDEVKSVSVYRRQEDGDVLVYQTNDFQVRTFVDEGLTGNVAYNYYIRSTLSGFTLDSLPGTGVFYESLGRQLTTVSSTSNKQSFLIVPKLPNSTGSLYVYSHGLSKTEERRYSVSRYGTGRLSESRGSPRVREDRDLDPASLSGDTPGRELRVSNGSASASVELFLSGITLDADELVARAHTSGTAVLTHRWPRDQAAKTSLSAESFSGNVYLAAGRKLRVLDNTFTPVAEFDMSAEPSSIEASEGLLWMTIRSPAQLLRGELDLTGSIPAGVTWTPIQLPSGSDPVAVVSNNRKQAIVLDAGLNRVHVTDLQGDVLFYWELPEGVYDRGDIAATSQNVFVLDNSGTITTYRP